MYPWFNQGKSTSNRVRDSSAAFFRPTFLTPKPPIIKDNIRRPLEIFLILLLLFTETKINNIYNYLNKIINFHNHNYLQWHMAATHILLKRHYKNDIVIMCYILKQHIFLVKRKKIIVKTKYYAMKTICFSCYRRYYISLLKLSFDLVCQQCITVITECSSWFTFFFIVCDYRVFFFFW